MNIKTFAASAVGFAMLATPIAASAAPANPAASLSVSPSVRAGTASTGKSKAAGGGVIAALAIAAGIAAIGIVAIVKDDNSDSN